jgi:hypothetical protein
VFPLCKEPPFREALLHRERFKERCSYKKRYRLNFGDSHAGIAESTERKNQRLAGVEAPRLTQFSSFTFQLFRHTPPAAQREISVILLMNLAVMTQLKTL